MTSIAKLLEDARKEIAVTPEEIEEARRRRELVAAALKGEFPGSRIYFNGSLAHGDANDPLADFDIGVVVPNPEGEYGPNGRSSEELKDRARDAVKTALGDEFPNLRVEVEGRKRSVLIRFSDPVTARADDFTGDIICAVDHEDRGLWIPKNDTWDRSHPEEHTRLVRDAIDQTEVVFAHSIRLLKHWNGHHGRPFCPWHIKALALDSITKPLPLVEALEAFFSEALAGLKEGTTPDPAGVGSNISPNVTLEDARKKLSQALDHIRAAREAEEEERPLRAQAEMASVLKDIVPEPDPGALADEDRKTEIGRISVGASTGVGSGAGVALPRSRGWSDR